MRYVLVTPPDPVVTLDEAKAHLRVDDNDQDELITALVAAATGHFDGRAGILGRAIGSQTWRLDVCAPWGGMIRLDMLDVQSVTSVKYLSSGTETTWSSAQWRLGANRNLSFVEAKAGYSFPAADDQEDAYRVTFVAGMSATAPALAAVKAAIKLIVGDMFENRETVTVGASATAIPMIPTVDRLIDPHRHRLL